MSNSGRRARRLLSVTGFLLIALAGGVAIFAHGLYVGPIATLALFLGFVCVVMSAFYPWIRGTFTGLGVNISIERVRRTRRR